MKIIEINEGKGMSEGKTQIWIDGGIYQTLPSAVPVTIALQVAIGIGRDLEVQGEEVKVLDCASTSTSVCKECGGDDVEIRAWVHQRDGNISGETGEDEDTYCNDCKEHTGVEGKDVTEPIIIYETK